MISLGQQDDPLAQYTCVTIPSVESAEGTLWFQINYLKNSNPPPLNQDVVVIRRCLTDFKELKSRLPEEFPIEVPENLESNEHLRLLLQVIQRQNLRQVRQTDIFGV